MATFPLNTAVSAMKDSKFKHSSTSPPATGHTAGKNANRTASDMANQREAAESVNNHLNHEDLPLPQDDDVKSQSSYRAMHEYVAAASKSGLDQEQTRQIKEIWKLAIENEERIKGVERTLKKQIEAMRTDMRQLNVKSDLELQQGVRQEMYEQIK